MLRKEKEAEATAAVSALLAELQEEEAEKERGNKKNSQKARKKERRGMRRRRGRRSVKRTRKGTKQGKSRNRTTGSDTERNESMKRVRKAMTEATMKELGHDAGFYWLLSGGVLMTDPCIALDGYSSDGRWWPTSPRSRPAARACCRLPRGKSWVSSMPRITSSAISCRPGLRKERGRRDAAGRRRRS